MMNRERNGWKGRVRKMKLGVVDIGGGLRGVYAAGIFDYCMEEDIRFDCCTR